MANQPAGKAPSDSPALKPYRGKLAVRNFRGGNGNVGIIRSPVRAIALPDMPDNGPQPPRGDLAWLGNSFRTLPGSPGWRLFGACGYRSPLRPPRGDAPALPSRHQYFSPRTPGRRTNPAHSTSDSTSDPPPTSA